MYRRLLLGSVSSSGCRKLHMSAAITRAAATATARSPIETPEANEHADANVAGERTHDYIDITNTQRLILGIGSSLAALVNPRRFVSDCLLGEHTNSGCIDRGFVDERHTIHTHTHIIYVSIRPFYICKTYLYASNRP